VAFSSPTMVQLKQVRRARPSSRPTACNCNLPRAPSRLRARLRPCPLRAQGARSVAAAAQQGNNVRDVKAQVRFQSACVPLRAQRAHLRQATG
jgi:hypothetical protein